LIKAAIAREEILSEPKPFVLQTSLDDFYVSYTLKAFTNEPQIYRQNKSICLVKVPEMIASPEVKFVICLVKAMIVIGIKVLKYQ
jgi:small-conductance mechanosensitive channel